MHKKKPIELIRLNIKYLFFVLYSIKIRLEMVFKLFHSVIIDILQNFFIYLFFGIGVVICFQLVFFYPFIYEVFSDMDRYYHQIQHMLWPTLIHTLFFPHIAFFRSLSQIKTNRSTKPFFLFIFYTFKVTMAYPIE